MSHIDTAKMPFILNNEPYVLVWIMTIFRAGEKVQGVVYPRRTRNNKCGPLRHAGQPIRTIQSSRESREPKMRKEKRMQWERERESIVVVPRASSAGPPFLFLFSSFLISFYRPNEEEEEGQKWYGEKKGGKFSLRLLSFFRRKHLKVFCPSGSFSFGRKSVGITKE